MRAKPNSRVYRLAVEILTSLFVEVVLEGSTASGEAVVLALGEEFVPKTIRDEDEASLHKRGE